MWGRGTFPASWLNYRFPFTLEEGPRRREGFLNFKVNLGIGRRFIIPWRNWAKGRRIGGYEFERRPLFFG